MANENKLTKVLPPVRVSEKDYNDLQKIADRTDEGKISRVVRRWVKKGIANATGRGL